MEKMAGKVVPTKKLFTKIGIFFAVLAALAFSPKCYERNRIRKEYKKMSAELENFCLEKKSLEKGILLGIYDTNKNGKPDTKIFYGPSKKLLLRVYFDDEREEKEDTDYIKTKIFFDSAEEIVKAMYSKKNSFGPLKTKGF